jgi:hypothetical protein
MERIVYFVLILCALVYNVYALVLDWETNGLLFGIGVLILLITAAGSLLQLVGDEALEIKWMLWYTLPAALLALGATANYFDMINSALSMAGIKSISSPIPGRAEDYAHAVCSHFALMLYPLAARLVAFLVYFMDTLLCSNYSKRAR